MESAWDGLASKSDGDDVDYGATSRWPWTEKQQQTAGGRRGRATEGVKAVGQGWADASKDCRRASM